MTTFPNSPRLLKGALVGFDLFNPLASVIVFQYNPDKVSRSLKAQTMGNDEHTRSDPLRLTGAPIESIKMDVDIDATDQLEQADGLATTLGIYPQLSALEMLIYPKSINVVINTGLMLFGTVEVIPPLAPFTVLVWGVKRVVPVRVTDFSIDEEAHDVNLNPTHAKVSLGLRVLNYNDFSVTDPGYYVFLAHQVVKEAMATIGSVNNLASAATGVTKII